MHIDRYKNPDGDVGGFLMPGDCCHYDDERSLITTGLLGFCGCGRPEENLAFIRDGLQHIDEAISASPDPWKDRPAWDAWFAGHKAREIEIFGNERAAYFFFYWADKNGLTDHGGSVPGWLSDKGRELIEDLQELTRREEIPA